MTDSSQEQLNQIEITLEQANALIADGEALNRLYNNKDFKRIILDEFFEKHAIRLVHLKASPARQEKQAQLDILKEMDVIGGLRDYFRVIMGRANLAAKELPGNEKTRDELNEEVL
jgi:hypothetical protein